MTIFRRFAKPISHLVIAGLLVLGMHVPAANAALIGTGDVVSAGKASQARAHIENLLQREDVKAQLLARGVDPDAVQARVDSLTDQEINTLAGKLDQLPAGGDALGLIVFLFIVLLITDILGFTDIFPFVKKPAKR